MPTISAKHPSPLTNPKLVVFFVYHNIVLLDLVGPLQVFTHALDQESKTKGYQTAVVSVDGKEVETNTSVSIETELASTYFEKNVHTLVVIGGDGAYDAMRDRLITDAVKRLAASADRVCSVCSGALILAAAGLLEGRRAVTHWEDCDQLEELFPNVKVERDPIYVRDDQIWTSAGVTSGIDMSFAVVSEDLGRPATLELARSMVTPVVRSGGQSQFSPALMKQASDATGKFDDLHQWITQNLTSDLRVDALARQAGMSPRSFARQYTSAMKITPAKAIESIRIDVARKRLERTTDSIQEIARHCGFNDMERMRRSFYRHLNTSPSDYRTQFRETETNK